MRRQRCYARPHSVKSTTSTPRARTRHTPHTPHTKERACILRRLFSLVSSWLNLCSRSAISRAQSRSFSSCRFFSIHCVALQGGR